MKKKGFTLIELIVASTIATVVLIVSFALIGNIYFARKQIRIAQNFYTESRFLLDKIVKISRENTIDYDKYFERVGPNENPFNPNNCGSSFDPSQGGPANEGYNVRTNTEGTRKNLGYQNIFYWEVSDGVYRNLGGVDISGDIDKCAQAFHGELPELYLINEERNVRTTIRLDDDNAGTLVDERIQTSVELGADTDSDGIADYWRPYYKWEEVSTVFTCMIYDTATSVTGGRVALMQDEEICSQAHEFQDISPERLSIASFSFTPYPDREPVLNFRNEKAQVHPNIFLFMKVDLKNHQDFGFTTVPTITMQTTTSSRVFKNTRK